MDTVTLPEKTITVKEVAAVLGVTERTVQRHLKAIRVELDNVVEVQNGISSSISEAEVTLIKKKIEQRAYLATSYDHTKTANMSKTNLEIITRDDTRYVNARDLHTSLGVCRDFSPWIKERIATYGFIEGKDFSPKLGESTGGRPTIEYDLSLSMAKELAIVENNEKGKLIRQYVERVIQRSEDTPVHSEKAITTRDLAKILNTSSKVLLENARKSLPNKIIENGKPTYWSVEDVTVLIDHLKHNPQTNANDLYLKSKGTTSTNLTPALKIKKAMELMQEGYEEELALLRAKNEEQEKLLIAQKPKADYYDTLIDRGNSTNLRNTAKELGIPEKQFIKQLQLDRFLYRDKNNQLCPYAEYVQKGYFEMKEWQHGERCGIQTLITVTGKQFFLNKYKKAA